MTETVLVVVAHPDDESISMAGTIQKHVSKIAEAHDEKKAGTASISLIDAALRRPRQ